MEKVVVISKPGYTTLRMLSGASGYFAFGAVPRSRTCRTQCLHFSQFRSGLLSSYSCHFGCSSRTAATATHLLQRTLKSVNVNSVSRLLNPRTCCQGSRNLTALSKFCASGETICLGEGETGQRTNQWQRKRAFRLPDLQLSLLPASSSREFFTCVSKDVSSSMVRDVLVGRLQSAQIVWQPVRYKSKGKKSKSSDDEDSEEEELDDDDYEAPPNFKKMQIFLKSLRADSVLSSALDISRNRVDEIFYGSRLRLNGEKLLKKSKQMDEGDYVDLVVERSNDDDQLLVKRVKVIHVSSERTNKDKIVVTVKVWKNAFPVKDPSNLEWKS